MNRLILSLLILMGCNCYAMPNQEFTMFVDGTESLLPYQDPSHTAEQRADDLLKRLTLEEKAKLMMDTSPAIPRLGIPQFQWWNEALHGVGRNGFATVFPITMGMAASWNDALVQQVFNAVSDEARAKHQQAKRTGNIKRYQGLSYWTPNINIFRDPRWGRGQETYGEDPYLTSRMGLAVVRGLQGPDNAKYRKLHACAKHFAVHSGPEWNRHTFNVENLPERDLWETYLPAFKTLVQEGNVSEVMCAYQRIDGQPCCAQSRYEQQILRDEWGFKGLITSDCGAISDFLPRYHNVAKDREEAAAMGVRNGTDVECGSVYRALPAAVTRGDIKESDIDRSLRRLLIARFQLGDFDDDALVEWTKIPERVIASEEHKQLALNISHESIVLLKNNGVLPLKAAGGSYVVMGPNANDSIMMWGNYCGYPTHTITALQGIQEKVDSDVKYIAGCSLTKSEITESRFNLLVSPLGAKGMQAIYWNNEEMKGEPVTTVTLTSPINLSNGGNTVFAPGVELEHFSARYDGTLIPEEDETLTLTLGIDDKVRLILNGDTLINNWRTRDRIQESQKDIKVKAGHNYRIQIDYVQETGMAIMQFDIRKKYSPTFQQLLTEIGDAETVIFVGGISPRVEGEEMKVSEPGFRGGDRTDIELPQVQRQLLANLHKAGKKVVYVNCSGGAIGLVPESQNCDAIIQAWYGGEQGGRALANVLFGDVNPSGKLPVTFYKSVDQLPDFLDYRMQGRTYRYLQDEPLYPFGYGLSYTNFQLGKPVYKNGQVVVSVKNTGSCKGTEVVQVYVRRPADIDGPLKTLRAYTRVSLKPGESRQVSIPMPRERFELWDTATNTMRVVPGQYNLFVGTSSADKDLQKIGVKINK
jgi:beta-glucosidase